MFAKIHLGIVTTSVGSKQIEIIIKNRLRASNTLGKKNPFILR